MELCCFLFIQIPYSISSNDLYLLKNYTYILPFYEGNYMQMMNVLKPIAFDVLECLSQLFDYYLFGVSIIIY